MDKETVTLLNEVVKNTEMGKNTVSQLLDVTEDERLLDHLHTQLDTYEDLSRRAHAMLAVDGEEAQGAGPMAKMGAKMGVTMQTMRDSSTRQIAKMLREGACVGVSDMTIALKDNPDANPGAVALAERLQSAENTYAQQLESLL